MRISPRLTLLPALGCVLAAALGPSALVAQQAPAEWLREASQTYRSWGRVDGPPRFAPFDCRFYTGPSSNARRSAAGEHGGKVYFLYSNRRAAYLRTPRAAVRPGFTVVKEAFETLVMAASTDPDRWEPLPAGAPQTGPDLMGGAGLENYQPRPNGDHAVGAGAFRGLFVMHYVGPNAPRSDAGWRYATVAPDGSVRREGALGDCMSCHTRARHRLFGLQE